MSVEIENHSELVPAPEHVQDAAARHPTPLTMPFEATKFPEAEEVMGKMDEKVQEVLQTYEGKAMDANHIEGMRRNLSLLPNVSSVGISVVEEVCTVALRFFIQGMESWIHAKFPALSIPNVIDQGANSLAEANLADGRNMRGKGPSGDDHNATEPYAEGPYDASKKEERKPD